MARPRSRLSGSAYRRRIAIGSAYQCGRLRDAALEVYMKAGKPRPPGDASHTRRNRAVLPSLVTAKLAVYETMRARGWSKLKLANQLGRPENSVGRLLNLRHSSHMWIIDEALAKINTELHRSSEGAGDPARRIALTINYCFPSLASLLAFAPAKKTEVWRACIRAHEDRRWPFQL